MLPLSPTLARKFDALEQELEVRVLAMEAPGTQGGDARFRLVRSLPLGRLEGASFYALLPFRVARQLREFRPDAVLVQGGQETALTLVGRRLARTRSRVIMDVHGDWRAPTRLYGSPLRRIFAPLGDALARLALRRSDAVRTISGFTAGLVRDEGREADAIFPAFMDLERFTERQPEPLPKEPVALFVGVLERYKAVDVLAQAWRAVAAAVPDARLHVVGRGTLDAVARALAEELPEQVAWTPALATADVARAMDDATVLVLPSRSEGLGRVVVESFCRGRGVVGARVGGIPDVVEDGVSGLLVPPGDPDALAAALRRVLTEPRLAERLAAGAHAAAAPWVASPEEYAKRVRRLVDGVVEKRP